MKFKVFIMEDDTSKEIEKEAEFTDLVCDECDFETTTKSYAEGDDCPKCDTGVLLAEDDEDEGADLDCKCKLGDDE
jgi:hypothetical protein